MHPNVARCLLVVMAASAASCNPVAVEPVQSLVPAARSGDFATVIRKPECPTIDTGWKDEQGQPITVACTTCHTTKAANADSRLGIPLKQFHQGLIGKHGNLTCITCHNAAEGFGSLRFADNRSLPYEEVMQLCAQCHGPQYRDYEHGAHGGMNGYWDKSKGGSVRNNCIDCHDPHAPKYPTVMPARGPNDRFLKGAKHE